MSKLSFRAKALDASKPMPIYMAEELPDLPDYSVINRAVPQMPSGMEKEEECEHHLQRAICAGLIIPTPEVSDIADKSMHDLLYPASYKQPRQLIHMQPFTIEQDIPDYDMDSEDERWLDSQTNRLDLNPLKFEEMMDRLEKSSGQTVVSLQDAKALLKEDDDLIIAVFDYWLNKRLKLQHPLLLAVKTDQRAGTAVNNPYIAFRRRTEKMQTRKIRKNDETSYEKMLKLRRDLSRAVSLLEFIKKREKTKRELVQLTVDVFEKRYHAKDFAGAIAAEFMAQKATRPAFTPIFQNNYPNHHTWNNKTAIKEESLQRNQKRPYKKRKHKSNRVGHAAVGHSDAVAGGASSDDELAPVVSPEPEEPEDEGMFAFRRNKNCSYHMPLATEGNWPWCSQEDHGSADRRYRYTLTSLAHPKRCIGFARRRVGRGGRMVLDRLNKDINDFWRTMDFSVYDSTECCAKDTDTRDARTECKSERTSMSEVMVSSASSENVVIKQEPPELETLTANSSSQPVQPEIKLPTMEEHDEMLEILQSVRREWLHFRPKTPPPDYSPPCSLLPPDEIFAPSANIPFELELKSLDCSGVLTEPSFVSAPFLLDYDVLMEVPVTDTRQLTNHYTTQQQQSSSTLTSIVAAECNNTGDDEDASTDEDNDDDVRVGCSRFSVSDGAERTPKRQDRAPSIFASPKLNNSTSMFTSPLRMSAAAAVTPTTQPAYPVAESAFDTMTNANGIVSQFIEGGNRTRINKYDSFSHPFARPMGNNSMVAGGNNSAFRGLHNTPAHAVTLNSHSTNILEIPMSGDAVADAVVTAKGQRDNTGATSPNSKAKTIVRKNLVMEVT